MARHLKIAGTSMKLTENSFGKRTEAFKEKTLVSTIISDTIWQRRS
jgi:hypothetical protein